MRHRVRQRWRESGHIGASGQVVSWICHGVRVEFKYGLRPKPFNHGVSMKDATQPQLDFIATELPRYEACGAWERAYNTRYYVSRIFLVPEPGVNKWRMIIDLRELNSYCAEFNMSCETLKHYRHMSRPGDYFVSLDLADGYYTLGTSSRSIIGGNLGASRAFQWVGQGPPNTCASYRRHSQTTSGVQLRPRTQGR
jgi:hypothetical protein